jgi:membrane-associated protease RseP (regulator of RpoE activity)
MFRQLSAFIFIASVSCAAYAQTPPAPKKSDESRVPQVFSQTISSGGGYLGVQMNEVTKDNFAGFGLRQVRGAAIEKVLDNSPAAQAGLQTGDVIVRFNGTEVTSVRQLTRLISEVAPDHQAKITISRNGSEREITATMGKRDMPQMFQTGTFKDLSDFPNIREFPELSKIPIPTARRWRVECFRFRSEPSNRRRSRAFNRAARRLFRRGKRKGTFNQ